MSIRKCVLTSVIIIFLVCITYYLPVYAQSNNDSQLLLKEGACGETVKNLQLCLKELKYFDTNVTGYYGPVTKSAVVGLQKDYGIAADGIAGPQTLAVLRDIISESDPVKALQLLLKSLNYFQADITGYYGPITKDAVKLFQRDNGLAVDGIAGPQTMAALQRATPMTSRANAQNLLTPWFGGVEKVFSNGTIATVTDVATGLTYRIKRITGYNHADCETLTSEDTSILLKTYGGDWSWTRRAIIVDVNGTKMAASVAAMPHAGRDDQPYGITVNNRSGGYGTGTNLDGVKNNNMSGVIDVHFYQSKTHASNRVDPDHQKMVMKAAKSIR